MICWQDCMLMVLPLITTSLSKDDLEGTVNTLNRDLMSLPTSTQRSHYSLPPSLLYYQRRRRSSESQTDQQTESASVKNKAANLI